MQKLSVTICALATMITAAYGGTTTYSGKEMKQVEQVPPCPEWYRDTEWNVSLWGTYAFTANNWEEDRYFESDHAWGGHRRQIFLPSLLWCRPRRLGDGIDPAA